MLIMWIILKLNDAPVHVNWHIYLCHFALHATERYTTAVTVIKFIRQDETKKTTLAARKHSQKSTACYDNEPQSAAETIAQVFL